MKRLNLKHLKIKSFIIDGRDNVRAIKGGDTVLGTVCNCSKYCFENISDNGDYTEPC